MQMGVRVDRIDAPFRASLKEIQETEIKVPNGQVRQAAKEAGLIAAQQVRLRRKDGKIVVARSQVRCYTIATQKKGHGRCVSTYGMRGPLAVLVLTLDRASL